VSHRPRASFPRFWMSGSWPMPGTGYGWPHSPLPPGPRRTASVGVGCAAQRADGDHVWLQAHSARAGTRLVRLAERQRQNNYLPNHDDDLTIRIEGSDDPGVTLSSRLVLLDGKTSWSLLARPKPAGEYKLHVELMMAGAELPATLPIEVVEPPKEPSQPRGDTDEEARPDVRCVSKVEGDAWSDRFGLQVFGLVDQDDESTIIWITRDYDLLPKALASSSLTEEQINVQADGYQFPVACGLRLQHHETSKMETPPAMSTSTGERHRLAEAVLVAMNPDVELADADREG
jgi:hypothetical protein